LTVNKVTLEFNKELSKIETKADVTAVPPTAGGNKDGWDPAEPAAADAEGANKLTTELNKYLNGKAGPKDFLPATEGEVFYLIIECSW
jgi:hypothetical protein